MDFIYKISMMQLTSGRQSILLLMLIIWSLAWKGLALWRAARRGDRNWFIAILVLNTVGILDILYIYVFFKGANEPRS